MHSSDSVSRVWSAHAGRKRRPSAAAHRPARASRSDHVRACRRDPVSARRWQIQNHRVVDARSRIRVVGRMSSGCRSGRRGWAAVAGVRVVDSARPRTYSAVASVSSTESRGSLIVAEVQRAVPMVSVRVVRWCRLAVRRRDEKEHRRRVTKTDSCSAAARCEQS